MADPGVVDSAHRRPPLVWAFAAFFLLLPAFNYVARAYRKGLSVVDTARVLEGFGPVGQALLAGGVLVGVGLLSVRVWGWWLFVVYAPLLTLYDLYLFVGHPVLYNVGALAQTALGFLAVGYFLRRDIYAPYLARTRRGWRGGRRHALELPVDVDGVARATRDLSAGGCFVVWPGCDLAPGTQVRVGFELGGQSFELPARVARVDDMGAGLAFLGSERRRALEGALREQQVTCREARGGHEMG